MICRRVVAGDEGGACVQHLSWQAEKKFDCVVGASCTLRLAEGPGCTNVILSETRPGSRLVLDRVHILFSCLPVKVAVPVAFLVHIFIPGGERMGTPKDVLHDAQLHVAELSRHAADGLDPRDLPPGQPAGNPAMGMGPSLKRSRNPKELHPSGSGRRRGTLSARAKLLTEATVGSRGMGKGNRSEGVRVIDGERHCPEELKCCGGGSVTSFRAQS